MWILGLDHIQLAMPPGSEDLARQFYGGVLGCEEIAKPPNLAARGGCWFKCGELQVHLGVEQHFVPARKAHPGFIVADIAGLMETLRAAGVGIVDDEPLMGWYRIYASDPFGNRLEFMQRRATSL